MVDRSMYSKDPEEYDPEHFEDPLHQEIKTSRVNFLKSKKFWIIIGAIVAAVVLLFVFVFGEQAGTYSGDKVFLEIDGTQTIESGGEVSYRINCINKEEVDLNNVEVELLFPDTFSFTSSTLEKESNTLWQIGNIEAEHSVDFEVKGTLAGKADELKTLNGAMRFSPVGIGSDFAVESEFSTVIAAGDLNLSIDAPDTTQIGGDVEYFVRYENKGEKTAQNLFLKMSYPEGFAFKSAEPSSTEGNSTWKLPALKAGAKGEVLIKGNLDGVNDETKRVTAELGSQNDDGEFFSQISKEDTTRIVESAESVTATIDGQTEIIADTGEEFEVLITYQNQGSVALKNAIIEFDLNPDIINFEKLAIPGGSYSEGKITWNSSGVPELALIQPNDGGEIEFRLAIKDRTQLPINAITDKNFKIDGQAVLIGGEGERVQATPLVIKLNSFLTIIPQGLYYNQYAGEPIGTGPMPPRVGEKTTYRITWSVENLANDIDNAIVSVVLAPGVKWENNDRVSHGQELTYEPKSGKISWNIGKVPANTGTFSEKMTASFDISITPGEDKIGKEVPLLQESTYEGEDAFTGVELKGDAAGFSTELPDDKFAEDQGAVEK
ncbi:hypothetical protein ACFL2B_00630 [Patescibacteria group bacterium]